MNNWFQSIDVLKNGGIAVIPTDTIYGIVSSAFDESAVKKVHKLKKRSSNKPYIILISNVNQLKLFDISSEWAPKTIEYWPGANSLIFPCHNQELRHLTCGTDSMAIRLPDMPELIALIDQTGPLIAPSANPENSPPANNVLEAKEYFKDQVDIYVDGGDLTKHTPSKLINLATGKRLR